MKYIVVASHIHRSKSKNIIVKFSITIIWIIKQCFQVHMFTWNAIIQDELSYILVSYKAKEAIKSSSFMRITFSWNHTIYVQYAIIIWAYITLTEDLYNTFIVIYVSHTWQSNMVISLQKVNYISFTRRCICIDFAASNMSLYSFKVYHGR